MEQKFKRDSKTNHITNIYLNYNFNMILYYILLYKNFRNITYYLLPRIVCK